MTYNHRNSTAYTHTECARYVGRRATLVLTGEIVSVESSEAGPFVKFQPDERFGFGDFRFGIDLDALEIKGGIICDTA